MQDHAVEAGEIPVDPVPKPGREAIAVREAERQVVNHLAREGIVGDRKRAESEHFRLQIQRNAPRGKIEHGAQRTSIALVERGEDVKDAHMIKPANDRPRRHAAARFPAQTAWRGSALDAANPSRRLDP